MKNYSVNQVLSDLRGAITVSGKTIKVDGNLGINGWGKIDFLKRSGYRVLV